VNGLSEKTCCNFEWRLLLVLLWFCLPLFHIVAMYMYFICTMATNLFLSCCCEQLATKGILFSGCPICVCVGDHMLKECEHDMLQSACGNFAKFIA